MLEIQKNDLLIHELDWQKRGLQQTTSGYGSKLTTRYKLNYNGKLRRVYAICYSNSASFYIIVKKQSITLNIFG